MSQTPNSFYVTGGTLRSDAPCYVSRQADQDLYHGIKQGDYCYVLTARQMGKSSLMVRAAHQLRREGVAVAVLDLTSVGQNLTAEQWYLGLLDHVGQQLHLEVELEDFWEEHANLGPLQRWMQALHDVVLVHCTGPVVILIDEIDAVRSLPFSTDEFFAAIRECYNRRTEDPALVRLTFCLFGVATPSDLIRDIRTTPFNIGRRIELLDFREGEAQPLALGLNREPQEAQALLRRIFYWTAGHPYLTQRMCRVVAEQPQIRTKRDVDDLCRELFLTPRARERDDNLLFVRERMLRADVDRAALLELFDRVRRGYHVADDETNPLISVLRLSGITRVESGRLRLRNPIYADVFDARWIDANLPDAEKRRQRRAYRRGVVRASVAAGILMIILGGLIWYGWDQQVKSVEAQAKLQSESLARKELEEKNEELKKAIKERDEFNAKFVEARNIAEEARRKEEEARRLFLQRKAVLLATAQGWSLYEKHLTTDSLPWFADALEQEKSDPKRALLHEWRLGGLLSQLPRPAEVFFHGTAVVDADLSPSGAEVVALLGDGQIELRHVATEKILRFRPKEPIARVQFVEQGQSILATSKRRPSLLLSASDLLPREGSPTATEPIAFMATRDKLWALTLAEAKDLRTVQVVDLLNNQPIGPPLVHQDQVVLATFSPDLQLLATATRDKEVILWTLDAEGKTPRWHKEGLSRGPDAVEQVLFASPTRLVVVEDLGGSSNRRLKLFDLKVGRLIWQKDMPLQKLQASGDGRWLLCNTHDRHTTLWNLSSLVVHPGQTASGSPAAAEKVADAAALPDPKKVELDNEGFLAQAVFSPDGQFVAAVSAAPETEGRVRVWQAATGKVLLPWLHRKVVRVRFSETGRYLLTASEDRTVRLWDLYRDGWGQPPSELRDLRGVSCAPDGSRLALIGSDRILWLCSTVKPPLRWTPITTPGWTEKAWFTPDGKQLWTLDHTKQLLSWDAATGKALGSLPWKGAVSWLAFAPTGNRFLVGKGATEVQLRDLDSGKETATLKHEEPVVEGRFSANGATVVLRGVNGKLSLWNSAASKLSPSKLPPSKWSAAASTLFDVSGDGSQLAVADGATVRLTNLARGELSFEFNHPDEVRGVCFARGRKQLATWTKAGSIFLWDTATGVRSSTPLQLDAEVLRVRFCADDDLLCTVSRGNSAALWDPKSGERVSPMVTPAWTDADVVEDALLEKDQGALVLLGKNQFGVVRLGASSAARSCLPDLCRVLSGMEVKPDAPRSQPLDSALLEESWKNCRAALGEAAAEATAAAWHLQAVTQAEQARDWMAALWHLERLLDGKVAPSLLARKAQVLRSLGRFPEALKALDAATKDLSKEALAWERSKVLLDQAAFQAKTLFGEVDVKSGVHQVYRFHLKGKERRLTPFQAKANASYEFIVEADEKHFYDFALVDSSTPPKDLVYRADQSLKSVHRWTAPHDGLFKIEVFNFSLEPNNFQLTMAPPVPKRSKEGLSWRIRTLQIRETLDECQSALDTLPSVFHSHHAALVPLYFQLGKAALEDKLPHQAHEDFTHGMLCWEKAGKPAFGPEMKHFSSELEKLGIQWQALGAEDKVYSLHFHTLGPIYFQLGKTALDEKRIAQADEEFLRGLRSWEKAGKPPLGPELKSLSGDLEQLAKKWKELGAEDKVRNLYTYALALENWTDPARLAPADLERYYRWYYELGRALEFLQEMDAARQAFLKNQAALQIALKTTTRRGEILAHLANTHYQLADLERFKENYDQAAPYYRDALGLIEQWLKDEPTHNTAQEHRAYIHRYLARIALEKRDWDQAKLHVDKSLAGYETLGKSKAFDNSRREWVVALLDAVDLSLLKDPKTEPAALKEIQALIDASLTQNFRREVGQFYEELGLFYEYAQASAKALEYWKKSLENHQVDLNKYQDQPARRSVAYAQLLVSDLCARTGLPTDGLKAGKAALAQYESLWNENNLDLLMKENQAFACNYLGDNSLRLGDLAEARRWYELALKHYQDLRDLEPGGLRFRNREGTLHQRLGLAWLLSGDAPQARDYFEKALKLHPEGHAHGAFVRERVRGLLNLAEACKVLEQFGEARQACQQALKVLDARLADVSPKQRWLADKAAVLNQLGQLELYAGDYAAAALAFRTALDLVKQLAADGKLPERGLAYRDVLSKAPLLLNVQEQERWLDIATKLPETLKDPARLAKEAKELAAALHRWRAVALARQGKIGAIISAGDLLSKPAPKDATASLEAAKLYAASAQALAKGQPLDKMPAKDKQAVADLLQRGVQALHKAIDLNFSDWARLLNDADFDFLRQMPEYQKLLERRPKIS